MYLLGKNKRIDTFIRDLRVSCTLTLLMFIIIDFSFGYTTFLCESARDNDLADFICCHIAVHSCAYSGHLTAAIDLLMN